jgi:hypothetical protein
MWSTVISVTIVPGLASDSRRRRQIAPIGLSL